MYAIIIPPLFIFIYYFPNETKTKRIPTYHMSEPLCYNVLQIYYLNMIYQNFNAALKHFLL